MGYLDGYVNQSTMQIYQTINGPVKPGKVNQPGPPIAATFPPYEVLSPQYPSPNPYALAVNGYRKNEVIYACIQKRATAISEAPMLIYQKPPREDRKAKVETLDDHPARALLERPNEAMSETEFWRAVEIYVLSAGFSVWEIEFNNAQVPINLWPMRPEWCSFLRGPNRPLDRIRYQPWGLPPQDVSVDRCLVFMEFDPIFPMLKGLSKSMVAMRISATDNAATDFLTSFFQRGAIISGVLKTEQSLQDAEAKRIRERWRDTHGGTENWGDIAVLGSGTTFVPTQMSFREMDFTNIDGRDEARICSIYGVPTLLLGAKVGLTASTLSNFEQARKQFQEETIEPQRKYYAGEVTTQLLRHWDETRRIYAAFDVSKVKALQEDQDGLHNRVREDARLGIITRDEAREAIGKEAIDNAPVFLNTPPQIELPGNEWGDELPEGEAEQPKPPTQDEDEEDSKAKDSATSDKDKQPATADKPTKAVPLEPRDGVMVGFFLSTHDARQIVPADNELPAGAEREETLHLTLAFLGKADSLIAQRQTILDTVRTYASAQAPMSGVVQGIGKFNGVEGGASDCIYASYDAVNLAQFRTELVAALGRAGVTVATDHGFVPHIALAYVRPSDAIPEMTMPRTPITFPALTVAWGNEHHVFPLKGWGEDVSPAKALTEWRKRAIDAVKLGGAYVVDPTDTLDMELAEPISVALIECKSASDVRQVFKRHWPKSKRDPIVELVDEFRLAREALECGLSTKEENNA